MKNNENLKSKKCDESCDCNSSQDAKKNDVIFEKKNPESEENKLSPTRFGDWEVKGRAIDF